jgi:hypothetical protein
MRWFLAELHHRYQLDDVLFLADDADYFGPVLAEDGTTQTRLFDEMEEWRPETREEFDQEIRIEFTPHSCETDQGYHNKMLLEWGGYTATRRHDIDFIWIKDDVPIHDPIGGEYPKVSDEFNHPAERD